MEDDQLRRLVSSTFKFSGFSLRSDACNFLVSQLLPIDKDEREVWLDKITDHVLKQSLPSSVVEKQHVEVAIRDCVKLGLDDTETIINVISAFEVPRFVFNVDRKKFLKENLDDTKSDQQAHPIFDVPSAKAFLYRDRYTILYQRTARHHLFAPKAIGANMEKNSKLTFKMQPIEYLLSSSLKISKVVILGLLTQLKEGKYFLEDPSGIVQLDLSETVYQKGLFTETCFVLVDGWYDDKILHIDTMGFPPIEPSDKSRVFYGSENVFGGPSISSLKDSTKLMAKETEQADEMLIFLSDVWLDSDEVMSKLEQLFSGYANLPVTAFVLMGNFLSSQYGSSSAAKLKTKLDVLVDIILKYPQLAENSKFIFVPGPLDPSSTPILPRNSLPKTITSNAQRRLPSAIFATNPCRIQYCTQEIVVIREDLVTKMCRNTIHFPDEKDIPEHFTQTILSQSYLCPLPLHVCPVYWSQAPALQLYPLPDVVVTADQFYSFTTSQTNCLVINPGSFPKSEYSFKVYIPASRQIEDSQLQVQVQDDE